MKKWQVNEFSKLAGVSVRTLHYYDSIDLLKASDRQSNGFRLYDEKDYQLLLKILSLKFLGFELAVIKDLFDEHACVTTSFSTQKELLVSKIEKLSKSYQILENIEAVVDKISLAQLLRIIGAYRILYQLEEETAKGSRCSRLGPKISQKKQELTAVLQQESCHSNPTFLKLTDEILNEISLLAPDGASMVSPSFCNLENLD